MVEKLGAIVTNKAFQCKGQAVFNALYLFQIERQPKWNSGRAFFGAHLICAQPDSLE